MELRRLPPAEAHALIRDQGYRLIDVRTVAEFDAGHPTGAFNIPVAVAGPTGMTPNPRFVEVVSSAFPKDAKLVVACKGGGRSLKAAQMLLAAGFTDVVDQRAGFAGAADPYGRGLEPGWQAAGLPVSASAEPGRSYAELAG